MWFLFFRASLLLLTSTTFGAVLLSAQTGSIAGTVKDSAGAVLPGASVKLDSVTSSFISDSQGQFTITGVRSGEHTLVVNYVGFSATTANVNVSSGQVAHVNILMNVAKQTETVIVTAGRAHGEAEAINETQAADTILNVLPADVITSLPNANIADAVGRLPGVTLERDEGEGKYVQIRGTEPRLSNLTIDGVEVPSPEGTIRQVKLDVVPAGIVDSVQ